MIHTWFAHDWALAMLHVIATRCAAHDSHKIHTWFTQNSHTTEPWPPERTCWRQFAMQWGDCKNLKLCLSIITILIMVNILNNDSKQQQTWTRGCEPKAVLVRTCCHWLTHWHWSSVEGLALVLHNCLFVGCLMSQQQASVRQGPIWSDNCTYCHTETRRCRLNFLPHPVTVYWHWANQSLR